MATRLLKPTWIILFLLICLSATAQDCLRVKKNDFPTADWPTARDRLQVGTKKSYVYYYGIGTSINYQKARVIAFLELEKEKPNQKTPFSGSSVLLMLYANGYGVKKDLDLCIRLACTNVEGAQAEVEGRVQHLRKLKTSQSNGVFDFCDDITSGFMEGWCASIESEKAKAFKDSVITRLLKEWTSADRKAFASLRIKARAFFEKRSGTEVDLSGTARAAEESEESESLERSFLEKLLLTQSCSLASFSPENFTKADADLNMAYAKIMSRSDTLFGTVTKANVQGTERLWIQYRDAWVVFGASHCPLVRPITWKMLLTRERYLELDQLLDTAN